MLEGKITLSDGTVATGTFFGTGGVGFSGVEMKITANDSTAGETRARFIEVIHSDWKV